MRAPGEPEWGAILAVFDEVVDLDDADRRTRLGALGVSDPELRRAVERLLAADSRADSILTGLDAVLGERARSDDPLRLVGRTLSHFRVLEPLARGGMGAVYRAEDLRLGRLIALKVPLAARYLDPSTIERFRREARATAALDHPNLCTVYETGETPDGGLFYTMPLYEGETLKELLNREKPLPLARALDIASQLARGLGAAHRAGIVHRDLKPANVMLLPDGAVKILDFGLAKAGDLSLTVSRARLGTVSYMAPEQFRGERVDGRVDLWALGVVLYEMATGKRPFGGGHEIGVAHAILYDQPARASALRAGIPPTLDEVLRTLLRKDPAERQPSAEALATSLAGIRLDGRSETRPKLRWLVVRRPVRWSVIGATALLMSAGAILARGRLAAPPLPVSVAVLPFEALDDGGDTRDLAIGLGDAIGTDLARLQGVLAPGYVTVSVYGSREVVRRIAAEQEVGAVLRATVQRIGDRVRVNTRLADTTPGRPLLTYRYERPASALPELEREVVRATLAALRVHLTRAERAALARPSTTDARAYHLYLRGRAIELAGQSREEPWHRIPTDNIRRAISLYTRARDLDPDFAAARARLALMHTLAAAAYDTTAARREQARVEAEAALRLQPGLPEGHQALASYWALQGDPTRAIAELGTALQTFPHSADLHLALSATLTRAGRLEEAAAEADRAMRLEPGSPKAPFQAATLYSRLRRHDDALRRFDRAIALAPDYPLARVIKGQAYLRWKGIPDTLAAVMETVPANWDPNGMATYARFTALWAQRRYADGLDMLDRSRSELSRDGLVYEPTSLMRARLYGSLGRRTRARASYARALEFLRDSAEVHPADPSIRIPLGLAYAGLGRIGEAVREAHRAIELAPVGNRTGEATAVMGGAVEVFARAGEVDAAFELLELLLSMPAGREVSLPFLRVWPAFDPLRSDPRFGALLTRFAGDRTAPARKSTPTHPD